MADTILHNQPIGTPSDSELLAYGTPTTPVGNISFANFYTLLMTKLGFFKVTNLFSEIFGNATAMAAARANLDVNSTLEVSTADNLRALKTNVIEKDSTVAFTPVLATHPINKGYADNPQIINGSLINTYAGLNAPTSFASIQKKAGVYMISIKLETTTQPAQGTILFTFPSGWSNAADIFDLANGALVGQEGSICNVYVENNTVKAGKYWSNGKQVFGQIVTFSE